MAVVAPGFAILQGMGLRMSGFLATVAWAVIHVTYLALPSNRVRTLLVWMWTAITRRRTDCLIIEPKTLPKPPLELPGT